MRYAPRRAVDVQRAVTMADLTSIFIAQTSE